MKGMSDMLADAYTACLDSVSTCCAPLTGSRRDKAGRGYQEKQLFDVLHEQPLQTPAPHYDNYAGQGQVPWEPEAEAWSARRRERNVQRSSETRTVDANRAPSRFSLRNRFRSASGPVEMRRAQISAPYNFRHLDAESYQFPQYTNLQNIPQPGPTDFRPIELSIYERKRSLSPLLPYFEMVTLPTPPPAAQLPPARRSDDFDLGHERGHSNMSFHIPRRQTGGSPSTTYTESPPRIPPKSRARANTSSTIETMKERIARGLNEMEALQKEIDFVMERQSIYAASSRPSTAYSSGPFDLEPMPLIPALPPAAPSFSERLTPGGERPRKAPARRPHTPPSQRALNGVGPAAAFITPPPSRERVDRIPPPPLPLVLRPPLRKKKSFSRVSSWLFPGQAEQQEKQHQRDISLDSVTNLPRPIKGREGFYQCVTRPGGQVERCSFETDVTVSTWVTEEDEQTAPTTTWSPGSTPVTKAEQTMPLERTSTFGKEDEVLRARTPGVVGVAF